MHWIMWLFCSGRAAAEARAWAAAPPMPVVVLAVVNPQYARHGR